MKTKILLLGAVLTTFALTSFASETLLSPRAAGNEIKQFTGTYNDPNLVSVDHYTVVISPRAGANQIASVAGTNNDVNPALVCAKTMAGSPKAIQACLEKPKACMACCGVVATK